MASLDDDSLVTSKMEAATKEQLVKKSVIDKVSSYKYFFLEQDKSEQMLSVYIESEMC